MRFASSEVIELFVDNRKGLRAKAASRAEACLCCRSPRIRHLFDKSFFGHWECRECGFVFVNPRPSEAELVSMYSSLAYLSKRAELFEVPRIREGMSFNVTMDVDRWYGEIAGRIAARVPGGALLDIGGGSGRFLKFMKDRYPSFEGTLAEVQTSLCAVAREVFGLRTFNGGVEALVAEGRKFDAVVSVATVEHVFDPAAYLRGIRAVLRDGGVAYLTGPRLGRLSKSISTSAVYDVAPPVHLNFFDEDAMRALLRTHAIPLAIRECPQSHGPVFHLGHLFCKHNYLVEDVIVEEKYEAPSRVYLYRDNSRITELACAALDRATRALKPLLQALDGQRVQHFVLEAC